MLYSTLEGDFVREWGYFFSGDREYFVAVGVVICNEEVYTMDQQNGSIHVFTLQGFCCTWGSQVDGQGQFKFGDVRFGMASYNQEVYTTDLNGRVQIFR